MAKQEWNAENYAREGRFVANLAISLVDELAPLPGERVLDIGCGDGALTRRIADAGAIVVGIDNSPVMIEAARAAGLDARCISADALNFTGDFDAVFSNAALHWMRNQDAMLAGVFRALKPGGRFIAEFGGHGNIAAVRLALRAALKLRGFNDLLAAEDFENFFSTDYEYRVLLEEQGFCIDHIELIPRRTRLGAGGIRGWYRTFRTGVLSALSAEQQDIVLSEAEELLAPSLSDAEDTWFADYVRLRFKAHRPA